MINYYLLYTNYLVQYKFSNIFEVFLNLIPGPETFVMCYRVFAGEVSTSQLGNGFQTCQVNYILIIYVNIFMKHLSLEIAHFILK
jgi:hypothetical protein